MGVGAIGVTVTHIERLSEKEWADCQLFTVAAGKSVKEPSTFAADLLKSVHGQAVAHAWECGTRSALQLPSNCQPPLRSTHDV